MKTSRSLGLTGSVLLFVGVFLPAVSVPVEGSIAYFRGGAADAVVVLALAVLSAFFVARGLYRGLWLTGPGALAVVGFTLFRQWQRLTSARRGLPEGLPEGPLRELEQLAVESVQVEYGIPVMALGALLVIGGALAAGSRRGAAEGSPKGGDPGVGTDREA